MNDQLNLYESEYEVHYDDLLRPPFRPRGIQVTLKGRTLIFTDINFKVSAPDLIGWGRAYLEDDGNEQDLSIYIHWNWGSESPIFVQFMDSVHYIPFISCSLKGNRLIFSFVSTGIAGDNEVTIEFARYPR